MGSFLVHFCPTPTFKFILHKNGHGNEVLPGIGSCGYEIAKEAWAQVISFFSLLNNIFCVLIFNQVSRLSSVFRDQVNDIATINFVLTKSSLIFACTNSQLCLLFICQKSIIFWSIDVFQPFDIYLPLCKVLGTVFLKFLEVCLHE